MARTFVVRPFGIQKDASGRDIDFERIHREMIKPALEANGLSGDTTGEIVDAGNIREDMFRLILEADIVVCDITVRNANVFYELGIRHALRKKNTVLIKGDPSEDKTPFDLLTDRYFCYDIAAPAKRVDALAQTIGASMASDRLTDSPVFQMVPALPEADPENVQVAPPDFREDVKRARAAKSKGWLRLLSDEVRGQRFERSGLKLVAQVQWQVKDYEGARESWETIRGTHLDDVAANLALANIYERQSGDKSHSPGTRAELLERSDQALERVLANPAVIRKDRAEALTLKGRNQKTHWRASLEEATGPKASPKERRQLALSRPLMQSYESYLGAFQEDLNHFYPGLVALQMGSILLDLSSEDGWNDVFSNDKAAADYRDDLKQMVSCLNAAVPLSVKAALDKLDEQDAEYRWARISEADVLFLTSDNDRRVKKAYTDAFAKCSPFDWDAARRQLELFAALDIKRDRAQTVIDSVEKVLGQAETRRPVHIVLFAGHQIDGFGRSAPRFPAHKEAQARALIKSTMERLADTAQDIVGLGSASPGADILWHEICGELGLKTIVCLPMPIAEHARRVFGTHDEWRSRFLDLVAENKGRQVLTLSDRDGLPRWLETRTIDPWERGNRWVLKMALAWGAERVSLVAFWDGKKEGVGMSGTAHAVRLAGEAGTVHLERIDSTQVLT
jgi:hypothetical protein